MDYSNEANGPAVLKQLSQACETWIVVGYTHAHFCKLKVFVQYSY